MSERQDRNITAVVESARLERERVDDLYRIIRGLQESITAMSAEITALRFMVASARGTGPTVR